MDKVTINNSCDLLKYFLLLPLPAMRDIDKRITDWLASGGSADDTYIKQQYRYAENLINRARGGVDAGFNG